MNSRPVIVISATRFFQGGTLVIVAECLKFLSENYSATHTIKALVFKKEQYEDIKGIDWIEFPKSRNSVFHRLYDEYIKFYRLSKAWSPELWLSLQDSTPRVTAKVTAVYYHNPLLLKPRALKLWKQQPRLAILRLMYKYIYTKKITSNDFVITQQSAIASHLSKTYRLDKENVWVFPPKEYLLKQQVNREKEDRPPKSSVLYPVNLQVGDMEHAKPYTFIFPATAFYYKNHAVILEACRILQKQNPAFAYRVLLTIDGSENNYVRKLVSKVKHDLPQVVFLGFLKRDALFNYYTEADCMIFPSFLESWGLPLTEFAGMNKPVLCADLPYGRETLAGYKKVVYFNPMDAHRLAMLMEQASQRHLNFNSREAVPAIHFHYLYTWKECFALLLGKR